LENVFAGGEVISRESFLGYVKDALANFYDPGRLQASPLVELLVDPEVTADTAALALRQLLRKAIESLRPDESVPFGRREWLGYRLLWLFYIQSRPVMDICEELSLGRTSFYRSHQEALEAVASYLWRMRREGGASEASTVAREVTPPGEGVQEEAIKLARASRRQSTSLSTVLEAALRTLQPLLDERGLQLALHAPPSLPFAYGDPAILRQILLNVLAEGLKLAAGSVLELSVTPEGEKTLWRLSGLKEPERSEQHLGRLPGIVLSRSLLEVYGGRLWLEPETEGSLAVVFTLPTAKPKTILIIDDNADAILRYRRCLEPQGYALRLASSGEEVRAHLAETLPDLILLDVLMPQEDGWDILQGLKTLPETASIPVVIVSVLSQPELAFALGAAEVLCKPVSEEVLLATIKKVLAQEDTAG